jgi:type II secretory pathway pseudopilin PulG
MSDNSFQAQQQLVAAALRESQAAFVARNEGRRQADELTAARLAAAEKTLAARRQWVEGEIGAVAETVEQGLARAPQEIVAGYTPAPPPAESLSPDLRGGLQAARRDAGAALAGIKDGGRALLAWQARRASLLTGAGIAALVLVAAVALLIGGRFIQQRAATTRATEEAAAAITGEALTAQADTAAAEDPTEEDDPPATPANATDEGTPPATTQQEVALAETETPVTGTPQPASRTPRPPPTPGPTPTSQPPGAIVCPGALPTRLAVGGRARVINYQLNVRAGPGTHFSIVRRLDPGRTMDILEGPVCDEGQLWYRMISEEVVPRDGSPPYRAEGWLVEESGGTYYLEPID